MPSVPRSSSRSPAAKGTSRCWPDRSCGAGRVSADQDQRRLRARPDRGRAGPVRSLCRRTGHEVRFIEYMPLDADNAWERDKVLYAQEIIDQISAGFVRWFRSPTLIRAPQPSTTSSTMEWAASVSSRPSAVHSAAAATASASPPMVSFGTACSAGGDRPANPAARRCCR